MGHFFVFNPQQHNMEIAEELQPKPNPKRVKLINPQEWTSCEKENELTRFSNRNKDTKV